MHGLVNRALQRFVCDTYGDARWAEIASTAALGFDRFEPMLSYDPTITDMVIKAACFELGKPRGTLLEDLGLYLVSHRNCEPLRRLLRFGGADFPGFLESLEDLPDRARLALPNRTFPEIELNEITPGTYRLSVDAALPGIGHILLGGIRGMADDYGALATIEHQGAHCGQERLTVSVHDVRFAKGRAFDLAQAAPA